MREILFRGKRKDNEEWVKGHLGIEVGNQLVIEYCDFDDILDEYCVKERFIIPETVGQYTGLKDKNDRRIFEGDIIRDEDGDIMVVKWQSEGALFVLEPKPYVSVHFYSTLPSKIEIIGNIHDDPELLEG